MKRKPIDSPVQGGMVDINFTILGWKPPTEQSEIAQELGISQEEFDAAAKPFDYDFEGGFQVRMSALDRMTGIVLAIGRPKMLEPAKMERLLNTELTERLERTYLLPEALEALREVHEAGYRLVICSNDSPYGMVIARHHGLLESDVVDGYVFSCTCGVRKPKPAIYKRAMRGLRCGEDQAFIVDDGGDGSLKGAKDFNHSIRTIRTEHPDGKFEPKDPGDPDELGDHVIGGIAVLPSFIESLS